MADMLTARRAPAPPAPAVPSTFTFDAIGTRWCIDTGRNIDEVNLSKVAGSSGTPDGFNAAIQRIKAEATN